MRPHAETIVPNDEAHWKKLRAQDLTSTTVPAPFGCSPYLTDFELSHRLQEGAVVDVEANDRMKWGQRLQDTLAKGIAEDEGWSNVRPMREYMRLPEYRLGSSFDWAIGSDGLLEIKVVDFLQFR